MTGCNGHCRVTTDNAELHQAMHNYNRMFRITGQCTLTTVRGYDSAEVTTNNVELQQPTKSDRRQCRVTTVYTKLQQTRHIYDGQCIVTTDNVELETIQSLKRRCRDTTNTTELDRIEYCRVTNRPSDFLETM
jgi:hypothetical protein